MWTFFQWSNFYIVFDYMQTGYFILTFTIFIGILMKEIITSEESYQKYSRNYCCYNQKRKAKIKSSE